MPLVFPGVVRGVGGVPVDRQEGGAQDHERLGPDGLHPLGQTRPADGHRGQVESHEAGDDGATVHVEESGVFCDESDGNDVTLLGIHSTLERVEERVRQARLLPGFRDEPECFRFDPCGLDEDDWTVGFVRVPPGE